MVDKGNILKGPVCSDFGKINCPCFLATAGKCFMCQGSDSNGTCQCRWEGFCIMLELKWKQNINYKHIAKAECKLMSIKPVSSQAVEIVLLGITLRNKGVISVQFSGCGEKRIPALYCYTDSYDCIHAITYKSFFCQSSFPPINNVCNVREYRNPIVGSYIPKEKSLALIVGLGIYQSTILPVVSKLQDRKIDYSILLLDSSPVYKYVKKRLGHWNIVESYPTRKVLFDVLKEKMSMGDVKNLYCGGRLIDYIEIINMSFSNDRKYNMSFFDSGIFGKLERA